MSNRLSGALSLQQVIKYETLFIRYTTQDKFQFLGTHWCKKTPKEIPNILDNIKLSWRFLHTFMDAILAAEQPIIAYHKANLLNRIGIDAIFCDMLDEYKWKPNALNVSGWAVSTIENKSTESNIDFTISICSTITACTRQCDE